VWSAARELTPWFGLEPFLPGAALFAMLLVLSYRFATDGFAGVRQHALAPDGGRGALTVRATRNWWSCTSMSVAACDCLEAVVRRIRRCCGLPDPRFGRLTFQRS
jgi:hypothetical protein